VRVLRGRVSSRFGAAADHLKTVEALLLRRTGLPSMAPGTLNVSISQDYIVIPDAVITGQEYFTGETLKLQRCRVRGHRMIIMRPDSHEGVKGGARVLELVSPISLRHTWGLVNDNVLEVEVEGDDSWWNAPEPQVP
jgi:hypothetical protein